MTTTPPSHEPEQEPAPAAAPVLAEVRYSLPDLLRELKSERASSTFGMERLDQHEIGKLFKTRKTRRAKNK
jgi:hypothetical protein